MNVIVRAPAVLHPVGVGRHQSRFVSSQVVNTEAAKSTKVPLGVSCTGPVANKSGADNHNVVVPHSPLVSNLLQQAPQLPAADAAQAEAPHDTQQFLKAAVLRGNGGMHRLLLMLAAGPHRHHHNRKPWKPSIFRSCSELRVNSQQTKDCV